MPLREGDLENTVLKNLSIDEYEPKTGDARDILVLGFNVNEDAPGKDLYHFLNNSIVEIRDVEVSPNPNPDGNYMVFVELDRNENVIDNIKSLVVEVERLSGKLGWEFKTPLDEDTFELNDILLSQFVQTNPDEYLTPNEWKEQQVESEQKAEQERLEEEANDNTNKILEFLKASSILEAGINDNRLHMRGSRDIASLEIVNFGNGTEVMAEVGISESAIKTDFDKVAISKLNAMLGEMRAMPIDEYIVIYNPTHTDILVTKAS